MKEIASLLLIGSLLGVLGAWVIGPRPTAGRPLDLMPNAPPSDILPDRVEVKDQARSLREEEAQRTVAEKEAVLNLPVRIAQLPAAKIIAAAGVRKGDIVVDIGAGAGLLSLPLAQAVTPHGTVYATDVDPRMVRLLQDKAKDQQLTNLLPTLVSAEGLDPFYHRQKFDVAILLSVVEYIREPGMFFDGLRRALTNPGGRVVILQGRTKLQFFETDFNEHFLNGKLAAAPTDEPLRRRLGPLPTTQRAWSTAFNSILEDPRYFVEAAEFWRQRGESSMTPDEAWPDGRKIVAWTRRHLVTETAMTQPLSQWTRHQRAGLRALNWAALMAWFRLEPPRELFPKTIYRNERGMRRLMENAGYRLVTSVRSLDAHDMWIFEPTPAGIP